MAKESLQVEYELPGYRGDTRTETDSPQYWLAQKLSAGGIEAQIRGLVRLAAIIGEDWLAANPERVDEVARAVDCGGYNHKIKCSES